MDTSPEYIKMCQEAEEIQGIQTRILPLTKGNWFAMKSDYQTIIVRDGAMIVTPPAICFIWLPRQDQLLGILSYKAPINYVVGLFTFCEIINKEGIPTDDNEYARQFRTMEQLCLAFMMQEKFRKCWNSKKEEWMNVETS